jgi:hypothetical protein
MQQANNQNIALLEVTGTWQEQHAEYGKVRSEQAQ